MRVRVRLTEARVAEERCVGGAVHARHVLTRHGLERSARLLGVRGRVRVRTGVG